MKRTLFRRIAGTIAFLLTLPAAVWLACCAAASFVSPQQFKYLALFSITAPFAIIANVALLILWLFFARRKWIVVLPLLALGFSYKIIPVVFGLHLFEHQDLAKAPDRLKVMTWNVHGLGIFDKPANNTTSDKMIEEIRETNPDILCLHEFYTIHNSGFKPYANRIMQECGYREYRFLVDNTLGLKIYLGIAFFSRYPISNYQTYVLHTRSDGWPDIQMMRCDLSLPGGKTISVFATHLQSFLLSDNDKGYIKDVSNRDSNLHMDRSRSFIRRFGDAYVKRSIQADSAAMIMAQCPNPIILCGDFNDLPGSYTYIRMRDKLKDAFAEKGFGIGHTYNMLSPTLRIDYIFYDPAAFVLKGYISPITKLSDHNPVIANLRIGK